MSKSNPLCFISKLYIVLSFLISIWFSLPNLPYLNIKATPESRPGLVDPLGYPRPQELVRCMMSWCCPSFGLRSWTPWMRGDREPGNGRVRTRWNPWKGSNKSPCITHDGSMVLLCMVCHGSHRYTPFVLAYIPYMDPMGNIRYEKHIFLKNMGDVYRWRFP